jgi:aryl-alcohol dehydrogenase-like predicted oxidoreductase
VAHVEENCRAATLELTSDQLDSLDAAGKAARS